MQGTTRALIDYALYNEKLLGNKSIIAFNETENSHPWNEYPHKKHVEDLINSLKQRFEVFFYNSEQEFEDFIFKRQVYGLYNIKSGEPTGFQSRNTKNLNHAVFPQPFHHAHGDRYAFVSKWLADNNADGKLPYVPHMVYAPEQDYLKSRTELRKMYGIPEHAMVYGRIGGYHDFNLSFTYSAIKKVLETRKDAYFLLICTQPFLQHERIIHIDPIFDLKEKFKHISACDAMLHARHHGETFGLSLAEFCALNKPIVTWRHGHERGYIDILKDDAIYYNQESDLIDILLNFKPDLSKDYNSYKNFSPENVMKKFDEIFLN